MLRGRRVASCVAERPLKVLHPGVCEKHAEPSFIVQRANELPRLVAAIRRGATNNFDLDRLMFTVADDARVKINYVIAGAKWRQALGKAGYYWQKTDDRGHKSGEALRQPYCYCRD